MSISHSILLFQMTCAYLLKHVISGIFPGNSLFTFDMSERQEQAFFACLDFSHGFI